MYSLLRDVILPKFQDDEQWAELMRRNFETCMPVFNTDRMLKDYCRVLYDPGQAENTVQSRGGGQAPTRH